MERSVTIGRKTGHQVSLREGTGALKIRRAGKIALGYGNWLGVACIAPEEPARTEEYGVAGFYTEDADGCLRFTANCGGVMLSGEWKALDWGLELRVSLDNAYGGIVHAAWVRFGGLRMPPDSLFALPHGAGFTVPLSGLAADECVKLHFPVFCSMQWLDICAEDEGVYLGVCDGSPRSKILSVGRERGEPFMEVRFPGLQLLPGERFELPPLQLMAHDGDWRAGAARYGEWFGSVFEKPEAPGWCRELPAWAWAICKKQHAETPDRTFGQLPGHRSAFAAHGVQTMQISGYMEKGHDALFPDYEAGPCMGGEEGLRDCIGRIHAEGGKLALYTNGRLADPASSISGREGWKGWCVSGQSPEQLRSMNDELRFGAANESLHPADWDAEGTRYKERYGEVEFAVMCPSSAQWREFYIGKLADLAQRYKPDGIYLDQVCGAWGLACHGAVHDHARPCDAWCGYMDLLEELRETLRSSVPGIYIATEGVNDMLGVHIDIFQAHNWGFRFGLPKCAEPSPDIFITAHPDYLLYLGPVFRNDLRELRRAFAYGRGFDIAIDDIGLCEDGFLRELDFAVESRRLLCPGILSAVPRPVRCGREIRCFVYELPGNKHVVLGSNIGKDDLREIWIPAMPEFSSRRVRVSTPRGGREFVCGGAGEVVIEGDAGMWVIVEV